MGNYATIPQEVLNEIRERTDIVAIVSDFVQLKQAGISWKGLCPFHNEKTPSFTVTPSKNIFHCFGCGVGGNVFTFLMKVQGRPFREVVENLASRAGVDLSPYSRGSADGPSLQRLFDIHAIAATFFQEQLAETPAALDYLESRAIGEDARRRFGLGYAPDGWTELYAHLLSQRFQAEEIVQAGLAKRRTTGQGFYDTFRDRIMFPIRNEAGKTIAFGGRAMVEGPKAPKYLNSPETPLYNKSYQLFNLDGAREGLGEGDALILVEGYADVVTMVQAGFPHTVACLGTALTPYQAKKIVKYTKRLILAYDGDAAGIQATLKGLTVLKDCDLDVQVLQLEDAKDPDEFLQRHGAEAMKERLAAPLAAERFLFEAVVRQFDISQDLGKRQALRELQRVFTSLSGMSARETFVRLVVDRFDVGEEIVRETFSRVDGESAGMARRLERALPLPELERPTSPTVATERRLVACFLQHVELWHRHRNGLDLDEVQDPFSRRIFQFLERTTQKEGPVHDQILENLDGDESLERFVSKIVTTEVLNPERLDEIVDDALRRREIQRLEEEMTRLQKQIRECRDSDALGRLMQEMADVTQRTIEMKNTVNS